MKKLFPVRREGHPPKLAACEAIAPNMKPVLFSSQTDIVPYYSHFQKVNGTFPVIINFPVMVL